MDSAKQFAAKFRKSEEREAKGREGKGRRRTDGQQRWTKYVVLADVNYIFR